MRIDQTAAPVGAERRTPGRSNAPGDQRFHRGSHRANAPAAGLFTDTQRPWRHRRRRSVPEVADRLWRPPLGLAVLIFAACGPMHALGHTDAVYFAVLIGLALSATAVPLGLVGLKKEPAS